MLRRWFLAHPATLDETYLEHMSFAGGFGLRLLAAGCACLIHAIVPCLFERTGSRAIMAMHEKLAAARRTSAPPATSGIAAPG